MTPLLFLLLFSVPPILALADRRLAYISEAVVSAASALISVTLLVSGGSSTFQLSPLLTFHLDALSYLFLLIGSAAWLPVSVYSISYDRGGRVNCLAYGIAILSMVAVIESYSFIALLIGWELMSIAGYFQIGYGRKSGHIPPFLFIAFSELSTILIIAMIALIYARTGSLEYTPFVSSWAFFLGIMGFSVKLGVTPFLITDWLPVAHGSAPTNGSVLFSATMTMTAVYCIMRFMSLTVPYIYVGVLMMAVGAFSLVFASIFAASSEHVKFLPAYSTIENGGSMLIALGAIIVSLYYHDVMLAAFATGAAVVYVFAHTVGKAGLFMFSGLLEKGSRGGALYSFGDSTPSQSAAGGAFVALSLAGLLPFGGGLGEWMLLETLFIMVTFGSYDISVISVFVGAAVALGGGLSLVAMSKIAGFGTRSGKRAIGGGTMHSSIALTGATVLILGLVSSFLLIGTGNAIRIISGASMDGLIKGLLAVPQGLLITSPGPDGIFGLISPFYLALLITLFSCSAFLLLGFRSQTRKVPVWSGGTTAGTAYDSYQYSNPMRLMFRHLFTREKSGTGELPANAMWAHVRSAASGYSRFSAAFGRWFMNSSINRYMLYIVIAFIAVLMYVAI